MAGYLTDGLPQFTGPFTGDERLFLDTTIPGGAFPQLAYVTFSDLAGAIAAQITGGGGTPAWLPAGATTFIDPKNGHYWTNGAEVTAADVFDHPALVQAGVGLVITSTDTTVGIIGDALTDLAQSSGTVVVQSSATAEAFNNVTTVVANNADDSIEKWNVQFQNIDTDPVSGTNVSRYNNDSSSYAEQTAGVNTATGKIAFNYDDAGGMALSYNGQSVVEDNTVVSGDFTATEVIINGFAPDGTPDSYCTLELLVRYDLKPAADLPALSTIA